MTQNKIPTDPEARKAYFREIGRRGGKKNATSPKAVRPFSDTPGLAKEAGSTKGYTFERKKKPSHDN